MASQYHGFQVVIHALSAEFSYKKGKIYKSKKSAQNAISKIVNSVDDGSLVIENFSYCEIKEWFSDEI